MGGEAAGLEGGDEEDAGVGEGAAGDAEAARDGEAKGEGEGEDEGEVLGKGVFWEQCAVVTGVSGLVLNAQRTR